MQIIENTIQSIKPVQSSFMDRAQARLDSLTKPQGSLGFLEDIARRCAAAQGTERPNLDRKKVFVFAADHGVALEGVSLYPREVTAQMVLNFVRGGAAVNVLARHAGADLDVVDVGVDYDFGAEPGMVHRKVRRGTRNMLAEPAMSHEELEAAVAVGVDLAQQAARDGYQAVITGEMGIGNTTPSSAITAVLTGKTVYEVTGRGTGLDDAGVRRKADVVARCIAAHNPDPGDALEVLRTLGGLEIAAITGLVLGAAANGLMVIVDGFISSAAALVACLVAPTVRDYMFLGHRSAEPGHAAVAQAIGLRPVLSLDMRLGEGTGAVLAATVIDAALKLYHEMATFGDAGVSDAG